MTQTTSDVRAKYVDRVKKLLAKAESTTSEAEADAFFAKAQALMTEWQIEQAELRDVTDAVVKHEMKLSSTMPTADVSAVANVAAHYDLKVLYREYVAGYQTAAAIIFGHASDVDRFLMLWSSLELQMIRAMRQAEDPRANRAAQRRFRQSFKVGYTRRVGARLASAKAATIREAEARTPGVGLVLVSRAELVEQAAAAESGGVRRSSLRLDQRAVAAGASAADAADLGGTRLQTNQSKELH